MSWWAPLDFKSHLTWLRLFIALVWLLFGLIFKALDFVPRHKQIVSRVIGPRHAPTLLWLVALTEISLGLWTLTGRLLVLCMVAQTALIATMNTLELRHAKDLLLSPKAMLCANTLFLSLGWYLALTP